VRVKTDESFKRVRKITEWKKVREYVDRQEEVMKAGLGGQEHEYEYTGEASRALTQLLSNEWARKINVCSRSKGLWKKEWKPLRSRAAKNKSARKELQRRIKEKARCWSEWMEQERRYGRWQGWPRIPST